MAQRGNQWPEGANSSTPAKPLYTCSGCGATSTSPINHDHSKPKR